ncbi:MAG: ribonuclease E/G [Phenylobacterium sp.]
MSRRRIFLDESPGETRGVVTLDGRPERLLLRRDDDDLRLALGARLAARVSEVEPALATAFLDLGGGAEAVMPFKPDERPVRGQMLEIEIRGEPRRDKLAVARPVSRTDGDTRLLVPPQSIGEQLRAIVPDVDVVGGREAREAADEAEAEALAMLHPLAGGGTLSIEPTRALTALDVDLGARKGADAKRVTRQANLAALGMAARLLRLKGLGGIIVIDLAGRGHDGPALSAAARAAFAPDNPGVAFGPISRFGTLEISVPRRTRPVLERLCREDGAPSDRTLAQRLVRRLQSEGQAQPGAQLTASCAPDVAAAARPLVERLAGQAGARFTVAAVPTLDRERLEVASR